MIKVNIPDIYDNFRTSYSVPMQCTAELPAIDRLNDPSPFTFKIICEGKEVEYPIDQRYIKLPITSGAPMPAEYGIRIEMYSRKEVLLGVSNRTVHTTGNSMIWLDSDHFEESLFIRMQLDRKFIDSVNLGFKPLNLDGTAQAEEAEFVLEEMYNHLKGYELQRPVKENGLLKMPSIVDVSEVAAGDPYALGLLFCHCAYKSGYKPIYIFCEDTCLVGLAVDSLSSSDVYRKRVISMHSDLATIIDTDFALIDLSVRSSFQAALSSAYEMTADMSDKKVCYTGLMEMIDECARLINSSGGPY